MSPTPNSPQAHPAAIVHLSLTTVIVSEYDAAIDFFVEAVGFELIEDSVSAANDGTPKRWVVVAPPGGQAQLLLDAGVEFTQDPRDEPYGRVVVWRNIAGNLWDLLGPST